MLLFLQINSLLFFESIITGCVHYKRLKVTEERLTEYYGISEGGLKRPSFEDGEHTSSTHLFYTFFIGLAPVYLSLGTLNVLKKYFLLQCPQDILRCFCSFFDKILLICPSNIYADVNKDNNILSLSDGKLCQLNTR